MALRGFSLRVSPLEPYHRSPEAAVECYGAFVGATDLDTRLKGPVKSQDRRLRLVPEQSLLGGSIVYEWSLVLFSLLEQFE